MLLNRILVSNLNLVTTFVTPITTISLLSTLVYSLLTSIIVNTTIIPFLVISVLFFILILPLCIINISVLSAVFYDTNLSLYISNILGNHVLYYPVSNNIGNLWLIGFLLFVIMIIQTVSGFILALSYSNDINYSMLSVEYIMLYNYYGYNIRYIHSNGASFVFALLYIHMARALYYRSSKYLLSTWLTGILVYLLLIVTAFMGYVLPWGQMSFWGSTVIINLLDFIPFIVNLICGSFIISAPVVRRFFVLHYLLPLVILFIVFIYHMILCLHNYSVNSNNSLSINHNNKIIFLYFITKDAFGLFVLFIIFFYQVYYCLLHLSDPENVFAVNVLVTPLHILPEWYFLAVYCLVKCCPNKSLGLIMVCLYVISIVIIPVGYYAYTISIANGTTSILCISPLIRMNSCTIMDYSSYLMIAVIINFVLMSYIGSLLPLDTFVLNGQCVILSHFLLAHVLLAITYFLKFIVSYNLKTP